MPAEEQLQTLVVSLLVFLGNSIGNVNISRCRGWNVRSYQFTVAFSSKVQQWVPARSECEPTKLMSVTEELMFHHLQASDHLTLMIVDYTNLLCSICRYKHGFRHESQDA